jgi:hypothetical protein
LGAARCPVPLRALTPAAALPEPRVPVGGVFRDEVEDKPEPRRMRRLDEPVEVSQRAEDWTDAAMVGHVVAEVLHRRRTDRRDPDGIDAEFCETTQVALLPAKSPMSSLLKS